MNRNINFKTFLLVGFCFSACLWSCTDKNSDVGLSIQPPNNQINVVNDSSAQVKVFSVYQDDNLKVSSGYMLLGSCIDPIFGKYSSSFFAEIAPQSSTAPDFGEDPVLDSLILSLNYGPNYGDSTTMQLIEVFEINILESIINLDGLPNIPESLAGYFDLQKPLGSAYFTPKESDTIPIKIHIDESIGYRLLNADPTDYNNWSDFHTKVLRGFYCKVTEVSEKGSIVSIFHSDLTNLNMYYRKTNSDTTSFKYMYNFPTNLPRCNVIVKEYSSLITENTFDKTINPDTNLIDTVFYVQSGFGVEGKIIISDIQNIIKTDGPFTLNKAFISIELADTNAYYSRDIVGDFRPLNGLYIYMNDSTPILDYISSTSSGQVYSPVTKSGNRYNILLTRQLYQQINNTNDTDMILHLRPAFNTEEMNRAVIRGYKNSKTPIKLHLTYVPINLD